MTTMTTVRKLEVMRKLEVVHKEVGGFLIRCVRIATSIAQIDNHESVSQSVSQLDK